MVEDDFFERNYVWQVYFEEVGPFAEVTLSQRRALPGGWGRQFDVDPQIIENRALDLLGDEDDRFLLDGFMALLPPGKLMSCSFWALRSRWIFFEETDYLITSAGFDRLLVRQAVERRGLFTFNSSPADLLFIGGPSDAHQQQTVKHWSKTIERTAVMARDGERIEAWAPVLRVYDAVAYACSTEVHFLMRDRDRALAEAREVLATVASRYGFILPPSERGGT